MSECIDTDRLKALVYAMGSVRNATDCEVAIFEDDATHTIHIRVGKVPPTVWGSSLREALDELIVRNHKEWLEELGREEMEARENEKPETRT